MVFTKWIFISYYFKIYKFLDINTVRIFLNELIPDKSYSAQAELWDPSLNRVMVISEIFLVYSDFNEQVLLDYLERNIELASSSEFFRIPTDHFKFNDKHDYNKNRPMLRIKFECMD